MTGKKKLIFALSTLALVVVVAAASVGITLAALSGNVKSTFTINYTASNVEATVSGKYTLSGTATQATGLQDMQIKDSTSYQFKTTTTNEEVAPEQLAFDALEGKTFSSATSVVYFAFTFKNESTTHSLNVTPTFTKTTTDNVTMKYAWAQSAGDTAPEFSTTFGEGGATEVGGAHTIGQASSADEGVTHVLWIQVSITSNISNAQFSGAFNFVLANA